MCGLISGVWRFGEEILGGWRVAGAFFVEGLPLLEKWLKACQEDMRRLQKQHGRPWQRAWHGSEL